MKRITAIISLLLVALLVIYYYFPEKKLPKNIVIDKMIVFKSRKQLSIYANNKVIKTFVISLGFCPDGKSSSKMMAKHQRDFILLMPKTPIVFVIKILAFHTLIGLIC